jgi:uncharacterized membrane protein
MDYLFIVLRFLHVFGGVFWVGAALLMNFFVVPAAGAAGEAGQKFVRQLINGTRVSMLMTVSAFVAVIAGLLLYWFDSGGLTSDWMRAGPGIGFAAGGVFGVLGLIFGALVGINNGKLGKLGAQIQGQPTPEQLAQMGAIRKTLAIVSPLTSYSLIIATILMAVARYLRF